MSNIHIRIERSPNEYNKEPVYYCKHCLSLKVMSVAGLSDAEYCDECGSTNIESTSIEEWETLYKEKHGMRYLDNKY